MATEVGPCDENDFYFQLAGIDPHTPLWNGHSITFADIPSITEAIASRIQALLLISDPSTPGYFRAATYFAYQGSEGSHRDLVEKDIIELLNTPEGLAARGRDGVIIPAGFFTSTWGFCKKHATEILIGTAVVAAVATVVIITVATAGTGGVAAAAAVGAAGAALSAPESNSHGGTNSKPKSSRPTGQGPYDIPPSPSLALPPTPPLAPPVDYGNSLPIGLDPFLAQQQTWSPPTAPVSPSPMSQPLPPPASFPLFDPHPFLPKDLLGLFAQPQVPPPLCVNPQQDKPVDARPSLPLDHQHTVSLPVDSPRPSDSPRTFRENVRDVGAVIAHEVLDGAADLASCVPQLLEEIGEVGHRVLPESLIPTEDSELFVGNPRGNYDQLVTKGHQAIDQVFGTDQAEHYTPEAKEARDRFTMGFLPPPGKISVNAEKLAKIGRSAVGVTNGAKVAKLVQLEKGISDWLGEGVRFIKNEAGDPIFLSKDGLRRVRFDFNRPYPHNNPHVHIEYKVGVNWEESGQIYPIDVPHH